MLAALSITNLTRADDLHAALRGARAAGYAAVELTLTQDGFLTPHSGRTYCTEWRAAVRSAGLRLAGLACEATLTRALTGADLGRRPDTTKVLRAALERAAWLGAELLTIGLQPSDLSYEATGHVAHVGLIELRFEAESRGVPLAIEAGPGAFPCSPLECREFLDELTTPWVGASLDLQRFVDVPGSAAAAADWARTLGPRVLRVAVRRSRRTDAAAQDAAADAALSELRDAHFRGPVVEIGRFD